VKLLGSISVTRVCKYILSALVTKHGKNTLVFASTQNPFCGVGIPGMLQDLST